MPVLNTLEWTLNILAARANCLYSRLGLVAKQRDLGNSRDGHLGQWNSMKFNDVAYWRDRPFQWMTSSDMPAPLSVDLR